ncbi:MAG: hypothetical protein V1769_03335 [Thermoplasmatota archaeon]|jgi:hypothetical protein
MNTKRKITIQISKEKMDLMKQMGISPQDIFHKGLQEYLREKYRELNLTDTDEDEDDIEYIEISQISKNIKDIEEFMINDNDIVNN